jgi:hypothetical protein
MKPIDTKKMIPVNAPKKMHLKVLVNNQTTMNIKKSIEPNVNVTMRMPRR